MRRADVLEVWAAGRLTPLEALEYSLSVSAEAVTWLYGGEVGAIAGVAPISADEASIWMLTTELVERHPRAFHRAAKARLAIWAARWRVLGNWVGIGNVRALRWARVAGFSVGDPCPFGVAQSLFRRIELRR